MERWVLDVQVELVFIEKGWKEVEVALGNRTGIDSREAKEVSFSSISSFEDQAE